MGCFESIHTIALAKYAKDVRAVDSRIEGVAKTLVRANLFGVKPTVSLCNIEDTDQFVRQSTVDVIHHVGVFYHLGDPVEHLRRLADEAAEGILLGTHYATPAMALDSYQMEGRSFARHKYAEGGRSDVFSGMYDNVKWLLLEDIKALLSEAGFMYVQIAANEQQRNKLRVTIYAAKNSVMAPLAQAQVAAERARMKSMFSLALAS